jgi:hypothetical protein
MLEYLMRCAQILPEVYSTMGRFHHGEYINQHTMRLKRPRAEGEKYCTGILAEGCGARISANKILCMICATRLRAQAKAEQEAAAAQATA